MNIKVHFLITLCALFSLGVIISNPELTQKMQNNESSCKINKGQMDCFHKYSEYKINKNTEVQYNLN